MSATAAVRIYAIAELGRCPRCLKPLDLPGAPDAGDGAQNGVCPHCEAVVGVHEMRPDEEEDDLG